MKPARMLPAEPQSTVDLLIQGERTATTGSRGTMRAVSRFMIAAILPSTRAILWAGFFLGAIQSVSASPIYDFCALDAGPLIGREASEAYPVPDANSSLALGPAKGDHGRTASRIGDHKLGIPVRRGAQSPGDVCFDFLLMDAILPGSADLPRARGRNGQENDEGPVSSPRQTVPNHSQGAPESGPVGSDGASDLACLPDDWFRAHAHAGLTPFSGDEAGPVSVENVESLNPASALLTLGPTLKPKDINSSVWDQMGIRSINASKANPAPSMNKPISSLIGLLVGGALMCFLSAACRRRPDESSTFPERAEEYSGF